MNKNNKRSLMLLMGGVFAVLFMLCLFVLVKGSEQQFLRSAEVLTSQISSLINANDDAQNGQSGSPDKNDISTVLDGLPMDDTMYCIYNTVQDKIVSTTYKQLYGLSDDETPIEFSKPSGRLEKFEVDGKGYAYTLSKYKQYKIAVCEPERRLYRSNRTNAVVLSVVLAFILAITEMLITYFIGREKENELRYLAELQEAADHLSSYKQAILSGAFVSLEANLTKDELYYGVWKSDSGEELSLQELTGLELPCSYNKYIEISSKNYVSSNNSVVFAAKTDREHLMNAFSQGKTEITLDYEASTLSGKSTWLRRSICITRNQAGEVIAFTSVKDISDLVEQTRREEAYVHALATEYDSILFVGFEPDKKDDKVLFHSHLDENITSLLDDEIINEDNFSRKLEMMLRFVHPQDREQYYANTRREVIRRSFDGNSTHIVNCRILKGDEAFSYLYYQLRFVPIRNDSGEPVGMIACLRNIDSEIRKEIGNRQALEDAKIAAEEASQAKSTFLFNMSHDIRTPLNAIIGFTDIAEKHIDEKSRVLEDLGKVRMSGSHLLSLINDVLDMSRIESGTVKIEEEPVCIDIADDNLFSLLNGGAQAKGITFTSVIDASVTHHWVWADRLRTMRVLTNIVSNSVKYTNPGGEIRLLTEELPCAREGYARLRYTVSDTGIGMSEEFLSHVFDPFSRAESSTKSGVTGTGLGMAITKTLTELMGGTIFIQSEQGVGTTVRLEFENRIAEPPAPESEKAEEPALSLEGKKILLVEDNELNREIATEILEEEGFIIDTAEDGVFAVQAVTEKGVDHYDYVLMDIQMPVMDGFEATRNIRALPGGDRLTIIALSANAFEEDVQKSLASGMNAHVAKPLDVNVLLDTMRSLAK